MACKTFQRSWIVRCGLLGFFLWFIVAAYLLKQHPLSGFAVNKRSSSDQHPDSQRNFEVVRKGRLSDKQGPRLKHEIRLRSEDQRTIIESDCPKDYKAALSRCAELKFDSLGPLPKASIVITFHSAETISSLLHTIHSIFQRTPEQLIEEIIVIDDSSQKDDFGQILEIYLATVFPSNRVKLRRNLANLGLIRSRLKGSRLSKGQVLVFMDSHSEVQTGWLEPLLFEIKKNRRSLVNSVIDWMEKTPENRWKYRYGCTDWTVVFDWSMGFGWNVVPSEESRKTITDAYKSKTIIGTYVAIDKQFFREIGEFDEGMEFWGGENIDLSIRVWLFDGQVLTVPCSRAAHLEGNNTRSYRDGYDSIIQRNYKRIAEVWFDEFKDCFYYYYPELIYENYRSTLDSWLADPLTGSEESARVFRVGVSIDGGSLKSVEVGNLSDRVKIKASAPHSFKWYLQNIFPGLGCPVKDAFALGPMKNIETDLCLTGSKDHLLVTTICANDDHDQKIYWSNRYELREPNYVLLAAEAREGTDQLVLKVEYMTWFRSGRVSKWIHWKDGPLMEQESRLCLEASSGYGFLKPVVLRSCNFLKNARQTWRFQKYTDQYEDLLSKRSTKTYGNAQDSFWKSIT